MPKKQPTKNQHYIPQVYLRGFSQDLSTIYEYNLKKQEAVERPVNIDSICKEQFLYEVRDRAGEIIGINFIEDALSKYEREFAKYRSLLLNKAGIEENYQTHCFLDKKEKGFWTFYAALNIMRNPATLSGMKSLFKEDFENKLNDNEIEALALAYCLPFFEIQKGDESNMLIGFMRILMKKVINVGYVGNDNLFTSDHGMYGDRDPNGDFLNFNFLWFPISSNCAICFSDPSRLDRDLRNRLVPIPEDVVHDMNKGIAYIAKQMILSKHPFSEEDIRLIEEARREREEDEKSGKTPIFNYHHM